MLRLILISLVTLAGCTQSSSESPSNSAGIGAGLDKALARPNIVVFLADDMGAADLNSEIRTPSLDRLAAEGIRLNRNYVQPLCTPTRASLLTGRVPIRFGLQYRPLRPWDTHGLSTDELLLPEILQEVGYRTACIGKWHLGHGQAKHHPNNRGFDSFYGLITGAHNYFTHERGGALDWQRDGTSLKEEGYSTDLLGAEAERFVRAQADSERPFFLFVPFNAPHSPLLAPPDLIAHYSEGNSERRATYMAMVEAMDSAMGRVLAALDETGVSKNTIVLFLNDNGGARIEGASNKPLRGGKGSSFEGGIRVPAIARWPNKFPAGATTEQVVSAQDWMPSLLTSCGLPIPDNLDGQNIFPSLSGNNILPRKDLFFGTISEKGWYLALLDGDDKYLRRVLPDGRKAEKLFNVANDPEEEKDLSKLEPEKFEAMKARALAWHALDPNGDPVMVTDAPDGWTVPEDWAR
ncbi:MAG TPA: arylsulfatase [Planctomycetota bacterium]|jgi:arylsulfatase A-like enzyme|nr:arylsulfatase [Planctomycetota bacterium]HJM39714.1 arylsulfatase [Planctomycetota bacterium]|tara:strand:+ start:16839 stop:18230 length:1392 start_codon:yes stop_codon:yes gene_type:complete